MELLHQIKSGDGVAFERLFERYHHMMLLTAKNMLDSEDAAKDAVQEVFMYIWQKRKSISIRNSFRNYLVHAVRFRCLEVIRAHTRSKKREKWYHENMHILFSDDLSLEEKEFRTYLLNAVEKIPPASREAFKMSIWGNKSVEEIASKTGTARSTVYNNITRAIKTLRDQLKNVH
ncbi:RNA polymerase sigma factor [Chitinophaga sp. S165]|uniref:RNA polymerase sigma factor n=1 Tax=Chitinophaga sp. S165 TaxID=2135462 RepID=UPI001304AEA8|nr:sigma-70 family RNA polymerase sigma factor [Chitinophaga sp. S165]